MKYDYETKVLYGEDSLRIALKEMRSAGFRLVKIIQYELGRETWNEFGSQTHCKVRKYIATFEREIETNKPKKYVQLKVN